MCKPQADKLGPGSHAHSNPFDKTILGITHAFSCACSRTSAASTTKHSPSAQEWGLKYFFVFACLLVFTAVFLPPAAAPAQSPAPTVPALFLSDIHFDPYADPGKVAKLNAASASDWPSILAAPDSPTRAADAAALQTACPVRGIDTANTVWLSSLRAIHDKAAHTRFATLSGDLLAHQFDCKFRTLLPAAKPADYLAFTIKTVRYEISTLRAALPGVPIYIALGNNDSGCTDYALADAHDAFLAAIAPIVADALPTDLPHSSRDAVLRDFAANGSYSVPLTGIPHTRLIVLDDLFLSASYRTCSGAPDPAPAAAQIAWLESQLSSARKSGERVWVMGHIPTGVNLYATARARLNICAGAAPQMYLGSEALAQTLAANSDIVRLALFGHTHSDEIHLLTPEAAASTRRPTDNGPRTATSPGVPVKTIPSITPVNGNNPSFTLAQINPATASLADYTVIVASNSTGIATTWSPEYTYSSAYHQPAFDAASVSALINGFQSDPSTSAASQNYLQSYSPGTPNLIIQLAWPQYACSMNHDSAAAFTACACATLK